MKILFDDFALLPQEGFIKIVAAIYKIYLFERC